MAFWVVLIPLLGMTRLGFGYPNGAPASACIAMLPRHRNTVAMVSESPYRLELDESTVAPGGEVVVFITGTEMFRGFLLQARRAGGRSTRTVGRFTDYDAGIETVACGDRDNSALTHTNRGAKINLRAVWRAPRNNVGPVHFIATVVKTFGEYWIGITSPTVIVTTKTSPIPRSGTPMTTPVTTPTIMTMPVPMTTPTPVPMTTPMSTTSPPETTAVSTTATNPSTTGKSYNETESRTSQSETRLTTDGTNLSNASVTFDSTTPSGEEETTLLNVTYNDTTTLYDGFETTSSQLTTDVAIETTAKPLLNETPSLNETTTHFGYVTEDDTLTVNKVSTTLGESYTSDSVMEITTSLDSNISRTLPGVDPETCTDCETSTLPQNDDTTVLPTNGTIPSIPSLTSFTEGTSEPSDDPTTPTAETSTKVVANLSTEVETIVTPSDNSPTVIVDSATAAMEPSTTLSSATTTESHNDTDASPFTDTSDNVTTLYGASNTSATFSEAIPTQSNESTTLTITPTTHVNTSTETFTISSNVSTTPQKPYDSITDVVTFPETPVTNSTAAYPNETSTTHAQRLTEEVTETSTKITTKLTLNYTEMELPTELMSTSISTQSEPTRSETTTTSGPLATTTARSTSEWTTESASTSARQSTDTSTISTTISHTERIPVTRQTSTASVITEAANEIRMRIRISSIIFTEDLKDPSSESFMTVAGQVEKQIWDLYIGKGVTTIVSVTALKITRGSIVPEVRILASEDFDDSTRSAWLNVMYNKVHDTGRLGNFSVSDISAVASDGTFAEVDPCFLLPCPVSMVCYDYQTTCLSNCYLNGNYCLNGGICQEPTGNKTLASCRCGSSHEGVRCDVRKDPVAPPNGDDNSHVIVAAVWGSIGSVCSVLILIFTVWLARKIRRRRHWRHTAKLMASVESGTMIADRAQMDSYARRLTSIRAGVLIDLANISISGSEGENTGTYRQLSRATSFTDADSVEQPRFVDGGVHIGSMMPDILQGASTTDYEMDFMNRQKRTSVSFNDVTEMIDFVATENFTLGSKEGTANNFQVRWDFHVDRSDSRETDSRETDS